MWWLIPGGTNILFLRVKKNMKTKLSADFSNLEFLGATSMLISLSD